TVMELVAEGQRRGIPIAPVLQPGEVLDVAHFFARGTFVECDLGDARGQLPAGYVLVDGERAGVRTRAPSVGEHDHTMSWQPRPPTAAPRDGGRALEGIRVLDLGVIVVGAEAGRLFADQGADVLKIENRRFPDGMRAAGITGHAASAQRNKRSVGIN